MRARLASADYRQRADKEERKKTAPYSAGMPAFGVQWSVRGFQRLEIKPVQIHHFGPGGHKVSDEFFAGVAAGIDFRRGA